MKKNFKLEELEVYKVSMEIGEMVWNIVMKWDYFQKKHLVLNFRMRPIQLHLIFQKGMVGSIIKTTRISVSIAAARQKKL